MAALRMLFVIFMFFIDVHAFRSAGDKNDYGVATELESAQLEGLQRQLSHLHEAVVGPEGPQDGLEHLGVLAAGEAQSVPIAPDAAPPAFESDWDEINADIQVHAVRPTPASVPATAPAADASVLQLFEKNSRLWVQHFGGGWPETIQARTNNELAAGLGLLVFACGCLLCVCCPARPSEKRAPGRSKPRSNDGLLGRQAAMKERGRVRTRESLFNSVLKEVTDDGQQPSTAGSASEQEGSSSHRGSGARCSRTEASEALLSEVRALASKLQTTAGKYPKSGRGGMFSGRRIQQRFVVVTPQSDPSAKKRSDSFDDFIKPISEAELKLWRRGRLGWWETEAAFAQRSEPKGTISLHKVIDVHASKTPKTVVVSHQDSDQKCWMELIFASDEAAEMWSDTFRDLLAKLNSSSF